MRETTDVPLSEIRNASPFHLTFFSYHQSSMCCYCRWFDFTFLFSFKNLTSRRPGEEEERIYNDCESCCCCSVAQSCLTLCDPMDCSTPAFLGLHYLPEFAQTHVHWVGGATQSSHSLSPLLLFSIFPSIRVFSHELTLHISGTKFDLLAVQGTLKNLFQHHNLKASVLPRSAFLMVQLSHLYMTTRKTTTLTIWIFVSKVSPAAAAAKSLQSCPTLCNSIDGSPELYINIAHFVFQLIFKAIWWH